MKKHYKEDGILYHDPKEVRDTCLNCPLPNDCMPSSYDCPLNKVSENRVNLKHKANGIDMKLIAIEHNMTLHTLYARVKRGGWEYALSDVRKLSDWRKIQSEQSKMEIQASSKVLPKAL